MSDEQPPPWVGRAPARPPADPWAEPDPTQTFVVPPPGSTPLGPMPAGSTPPGGWATTAQQPVVPAAPRRHSVPEPTIVYVEVPRRRRGGLFFAGMLAACLAGGGLVALVSSPALRQSVGLGPTTPGPDTPATTTPAPPAPPGIGDPVRDGTFEFTVTDVSCGRASFGAGPISRKADGQYCIVSLTVQNIGDSSALFSDINQWMNTSDGVRHNSDSTAGVYANGGIKAWADIVKPGKTLSGKIVFDISKNAQVHTIELHDSAFSGGVLVTP